jgi:hypothetical protein
MSVFTTQQNRRGAWLKLQRTFLFQVAFLKHRKTLKTITLDYLPEK